MSTLENYKQQKRLDPEPSGEGGQGLNYNFRSIADHDPNFIENGFAVEDVAGWAAYDDAAGATPVDGTGGSPTTTVTRTIASPLIGDASILLTKPASNVQGEGISYDFSIDSAYASKDFYITFHFDNSAGDDVYGVYIYDVTGAALIPIDVVNLPNGTGFFDGRFLATTSTSYRFIIHTQATDATAETLKIDAVRVSPHDYPETGPVIKKVSTTDATVTPIATFDILADSDVTIMADISGKRTNGTGRLMYRRRAGVYREGAGAAAFQGGINTPMSKTGGGAGGAGWDATFDLSGNTLRVIVTGAAAQDVEWTARISLTVAQ